MYYFHSSMWYFPGEPSDSQTIEFYDKLFDAVVSVCGCDKDSSKPCSLQSTSESAMMSGYDPEDRLCNNFIEKVKALAEKELDTNKALAEQIIKLCDEEREKLIWWAEDPDEKEEIE